MLNAILIVLYIFIGVGFMAIVFRKHLNKSNDEIDSYTLITVMSFLAMIWPLTIVVSFIIWLVKRKKMNNDVDNNVVQ